MVAVIAVAFVGMALHLRRDGPATNMHPALPVAAVRPLPADCSVGATGDTVCELSPDGAAPFLGFTPERPATVPPGIHRVAQQLRSSDAAGATGPADARATGYVQTWAPVGVIPDASGEYPQHLRFVERAIVAGDSPACDDQFRPLTLGNGHRACAGTDAERGTHLVIWTAYGVVHVLEGKDVNRAQLEQFAAAFP
jgi:hypothetical protein